MQFVRCLGLSLALVYNFMACESGHAQFSFDRVKDDDGFEFEKPFQPYWTPRYNRIEGLFVNFGARFRPVSAPGVQFYGDAGWGFWNESGKKFRFNAGARKDFLLFNRLSLGLDVFNELESEDNWTVGDVENSLASLFFREDFRDYYGIYGFRVYADHKFLGRHTLRAEVERRTYDALRRNIDWSVFKGDFEENPASPGSRIIEGDELGFRVVAAFDWRDNPIFPLTGWYVQAIYEHTVDDFDTDGLFLTLKRFQQTFGTHRLLLRALLGTRRGSVAEQHTMDLGGIGSLRAFDDKEFSGNRMFLFSANYLFGGDILQRIPLQDVPLFGTLWTTLSLGVFLDAGQTHVAAIDGGLFSELGDVFDDLQTDVGLSVLVLDGVFRLDVARRTRSTPGKSDYRVTFRLLESF